MVSTVSRIIDPRPATPSLQGIYIRTLGSGVEVVGSDLDIVIKAKSSADVEIEGNLFLALFSVEAFDRPRILLYENHLI